MALAKYSKKAGVKSLKELTELSGFPLSTLRDMYNKHPERFKTVLYGCLYRKNNMLEISIKIKELSELNDKIKG